MANVRAFRLDSADPTTNEPAFYYKIEGDDGNLLFNLCLDNSGIYFYKPSSRILTPKENKGTRESFDAFLSFEELGELFNLMLKVGFNPKSNRCEFTKDRRTVVISRIPKEEE